MIDGLQIQHLEPHADERGRLMSLFRSGEEGLPPFGQVHVTAVYPGVVKGWHRHRHTTDVFCCVQGMVRLGLYDEREGSKTAGELNEFYLGVHHPLRILVPPGVWFGLKGLGSEEALVVVYADRSYDPKDPDQESMDPEVNEIPFDWSLRDR